MHLVFKNYVKTRFWKLSFFCQSKNVGKKAWSEKFFDKKIQQNWEFHEKVYAEPKPSLNLFPQASGTIISHRVFSQSPWLIRWSMPYVRILYTEWIFKILDPFEQCTWFSKIAWSLAVLQCICFPSVWQIKAFWFGNWCV